MDCARCAEDLTAFLDGELSAADSERIRSHLSVCASCAAELRSLREAAHFVQSHQRELEVRPEAWSLVRARLSAPARSPSLFHFLAPGRWRFAMAALAVVVAFAVGYIQYRQVQRRSLDHYISQYIQERRARIPSQPIFADSRAGLLKEENLHAYNPFADHRANLTDNPFRLEDR